MDKLRNIISRGRAVQDDEADKLAVAMSQTPPVSVRINPGKTLKIPESWKPVPWCTEGFYLPERPLFAADPAWHAGAYYVQESSSMYIGELAKACLKDLQYPVVLDLCAAPGGKSTHLLSVLNQRGLLVSNELIRNRIPPLKDNLARWGYSNCLVTTEQAGTFQALEEHFDLIVADVPCSGEGMIGKDPVALDQWSSGLVEQCELRQREIVERVWPALKPGGCLIYSTCTLNRQENEENIVQLLNSLPEAEGVVLPVPGQGIETSTATGTGTFRFYPHRLAGFGFFAAVVRKSGRLNQPTKPAFRASNIKIPGFIATLSTQEGLQPIIHAERYWLLSEAAYSLAVQFMDCLKVVAPGTEAGRLAGDDFIPAHALALQHSSVNHFPLIQVDAGDAVRFLRRDPLQAGVPEIPGKWAIVVHNGLGLGWVKQAGKRLNNYYPVALRYRKQV